MRKPAYPPLMQLMAKHGVSRKDISEIIGVTYRNTLKKINGETLPDVLEAGKITKYFKDLGEDVTIDGEKGIFLS